MVGLTTPLPHEVAGGVGLGGHGREEGRVLERLDLDLDADLGQIAGDQRQQVGVVVVDGGELHREAEAVGNPASASSFFAFTGS